MTALAIPVMPLAGGLEALLELRADVNGAPTGAVLAGGRLPAGRPGRFSWALVSLPTPVVVSTALSPIFVTGWILATRLF